MNATAVIIIAIAAAALLGALAFVTLARRTDVRGAGALSAETVRRDRASRASATAAAESATSRAADVEAAGAAARVGKALAPVQGDSGLTAWVPPDPDALGVTRRQFFNRATISLMAAGFGTFGAASFVAFMWPTKVGGFGSKVLVGRFDDVVTGIRAGNGFFYAPEARAWITAYPIEAIDRKSVV